MPNNAQRFYDRVEDAAIHLPRQYRSNLIEKLRNSLKGKTTLNPEWVNEIDNRTDDIESGLDRLIDGDNAMQRFNVS